MPSITFSFKVSPKDGASLTLVETFVNNDVEVSMSTDASGNWTGEEDVNLAAGGKLKGKIEVNSAPNVKSSVEIKNGALKIFCANLTANSAGVAETNFELNPTQEDEDCE